MLRTAATAVAQRLIDAGHTTYFAGGCVRDQLLGLWPKDYDIATAASPAEVAAIFPKSDMIGAHFGVVLVRDAGHAFEVATFRTDGSYSDSRRPDSVAFSTPAEDAQRRDFTINGLFQDPLTDEIIDHVGGRADLDSRTLRAIGDPDVRFSEDALRLLRAVRFANRFDLTIEPATESALRANADLLANISVERIRDEFSLILTHPTREQGVRELTRLGLMKYIIPEFIDLIGCEQPPQWHPEGDVFEHTCIALGLLEPDAGLTQALGVLLHDIGKPPTYTYDEADDRIRFNGHDAIGAEMAEKILSRLRYSNEIIRDVTHLVARHMQFMNVMQMRRSKLRRFMSPDIFELEMELHRVDCASSNGFTENYDFLREQQAAFADEPVIPPPLLSGKDLIAHGLTPSPAFKAILEDVQTRQLEGDLDTRDRALELLPELVKSHTADA